MTKEELYYKLCDWPGCITCGTISGIDGSNKCFVEIRMDDLIDDTSESFVLRDCYKLRTCKKVEPADIDIYEWGQELPTDCIEALKAELNSGNLYMAEIENDINRLCILFWE